MTKEKFKTKVNAFTRNRKLPFELLVLTLLNMPKRTLAIELHAFYTYIKGKIGKTIDSITTSAFTQSRQKLSPDVFIGMNQLLTKEYYTDNQERVKLWDKFRLLSIDGSKITLPYSEQLKETYGFTKNQNKTEDVIQARVSVLYDVLNEMVIEGILTEPEQGEITLAHEHIKHVQQGDLLILDRGYPSFQLAYEILSKEADFIFRCKYDFNNVTKQFIASGKSEAIVEIAPKQKCSFKGKPITKDSRIKIRLIRIPLESGEIELLMTSLTDTEKYPYECFKPLYFKRWNIETFYNRLKNILVVENFSGLTNQAILQDFHCAVFISNVQSLIIAEAQSEVKKKCSDRKYEYKINTSISLGFLKYKIIDLFTNKGAEKTLKELEQILVTQLVPIKNGRKFNRETEKYRRRTKPLMFKNRKRVI